MATIKVLAKPGHVLAYPGENRVGTIRRYIGRKTKITRDETTGEVTEIAHVAIATPVEFDLNSDEGRRIARLFMVDREDPPLWPADKETADLLGVKFVPVNLEGGEFVPVAVSAAPEAETTTTKKPSKADGGNQ